MLDLPPARGSLATLLSASAHNEESVKGVAFKIRSRTAMCPDCGADLKGEGGYCFSCGSSRDSRTSEILEHPHSRDHADDDIPERLSYFAWFDGLLFTRWWFVPALLVLAGILSVVVLTGNSQGFAVSLVAGATLCVFLYLMMMKRGRL
jgi:hypothetical protein